MARSRLEELGPLIGSILSKEAPEVTAGGEKTRWSCFLKERVDSVNLHRHKDHPLTDHNFIKEYWFYYENSAEWWEKFDVEEAYYYYENQPTGHQAADQ